MTVLIGTLRAADTEMATVVNVHSSTVQALRRPDQDDLPAVLTDVLVTGQHLLLGLASAPTSTDVPPDHDSRVFRLSVELTGPTEDLGPTTAFDWPDFSEWDDPTERIPRRPGYERLLPVDDSVRRFRGGVHTSRSESILEVVDTADGSRHQVALPLRAHWVVGGGTGWFFAIGHEQTALVNAKSGEATLTPGLPSGFTPLCLLPNTDLANLTPELVAAPGAADRLATFYDDVRRSRLPPLAAHHGANTLASLRLVATNATNGRSRLGGQPDLSPDMNWPDVDGAPLPFLAQIDLAEAQDALPLPHLPDHGLLSVFYCPNLDPLEEVVGWDKLEPISAADMTGRLLHLPEGELVSAPWPEALPAVFRRKAKPVSFAVEQTHQTLEFDINNPDRPEPPGGYQPWAESKRRYEATLLPGPLHRISGHSDYIQPTELGDLIIQIDGDRSLGWQWGDGGRLHVTVTHLGQLASDFSNVDFHEASH